MDYSKFEINDLLSDDKFLRWVQRPDEASNRFWAEFLLFHPHKTETVQKAKQMAQELEQAEQDSDFHDSTTLQRIWSYIEENTVTNPTHQIGIWHTVKWYVSAASVILLLGTLWWWVKPNSTDQNLPAVMQITSPSSSTGVTFTTVHGPLSLKLADGSRVQLSENSTLRFPKIFDPEQREVYLLGEGFFDITKRPQQPFLVHTNDLVTRVVGTSFWVKAYEKERDISVDVKTGKVSVYVRQFKEDGSDPRKSVTLTPNQKVVYESTKEQLHKRITDNPVRLNKSVALQFEDAPISEVFRAVEKEYGINIVYEKTTLLKCSLTTSVDNLPLFDQMKLICAAVNASYEQQDGYIIVKGGKCL